MAVKTKTHKEKRQFVQKEKKLEIKHYRIFIGLAIFAWAYYYFFQLKTIGHDIRYTIFIFWLPTLIGTIAIGIYRRKFLISKFSANKGFWLWTFMMVFYLVQGFIFSYLSFGQVAKISWDIVNRQTAKENPNEYLVCPVTKFWTKTRPYAIEFELNGKYERITTNYRKLRSYMEDSANNYEVAINVQKGLWNHYLVNSWTIRSK